MRASSELLKEVLAGSFELVLHVDVFHGTDRVLRGLPVVGSSLKWDYSTVGFTGSLDVVAPSEDGSSLIPDGLNGVLSPHAGAQVLLLAEVRAGSFTETVQLGWARIVSYSNGRDTYQTHLGRRVVVSSELSLELQGVEVGLVRDGFFGPSQPPAGATCYGELRRLTGMAVVETLPDQAAPNITYEPKQGGRWEACLELGKQLGGTVYVNSQRALTVHDPTVPVSTRLHVGDGGTILDVSQDADTDGAYNCVVGNFEDADGNPLVAYVELNTGPMRADGPYGRYTRYYASDFVKTQTAAQSAVNAILSQHTKGDTYEVPVQCVINPLVEVGDRVTAVSNTHEVTGLVVSVSYGRSDMTVVLEVNRVW